MEMLKKLKHFVFTIFRCISRGCQSNGLHFTLQHDDHKYGIPIYRRVFRRHESPAEVVFQDIYSGI